MSNKACVSKRRRKRGSVSMWVVIALCVIALVLIVYNVIMSNYWYVISYIIGIVLGVSYILVCLNELYSTWIAADGKDFTMQCWDNCFFPHQTLSGIKFFGELLPAKNIRLRVPIIEIKQIIIGTKTVIKRNTDDEAFLDAVALYENTKYNSNQKMLERMDILYISTVDGDSVFMNVTDFDAKSVMRLMRGVEKVNPEIDIKLSGKQYRSYGGAQA